MTDADPGPGGIIRFEPPVVLAVVRHLVEGTPGVARLGRAGLGRWLDRLGVPASTATVGVTELTLDLSLVLDGERPVLDVAKDVRARVVSGIENSLRLRVVQVNLDVSGFEPKPPEKIS